MMVSRTVSYTHLSVTLDGNGCLASYRVLADGESADEGGRVFYAYLEQPHTSPRYNGYTYVNTMDKAAIERFIEVTHDCLLYTSRCV